MKKTMLKISSENLHSQTILQPKKSSTIKQDQTILEVSIKKSTLNFLQGVDNFSFFFLFFFFL